MKKIYLIALMGITTMFVQAQPIVNLSSDNICAGETISATVSGPLLELPSPASGVNNNSGVMFDVLGEEGAIIKGFVANVLSANSSFEVYYRPGSYVGFENSSTGWTLLGTSSGIVMGDGVNIGVDISQIVLPGQTVAFYITSTGSGQYIEYADGVSEGAVLTGNTYLTIHTGIGKGYPFGTTNTPRDFIGTVMFEPILTNISWLGNTSTLETVEFTPDESMGIVVSVDYGSTTHVGTALVTVNDYEVTASASPSVLAWNQSSTLSTDVIVATGLSTTYRGGNSNYGVMFDVSAANALTISGFTMSLRTNVPTADLEVYYKTGTHVGFEATAGSWTLLNTLTGIEAGYNSSIPLTAPLNMAPGQTFAFYITRTDGLLLNYSNGIGVGTVVATDGNLSVKEGVGVQYPFGTMSSGRIANVIVNYEMENPAGLNYTWTPGGETTSSISVAPNADVTYTVSVDNGFCTATTDVSVTMAVGIEEDIMASVNVYPNPATDILTIEMDSPVDLTSVRLIDMSGKLVYSIAPNSAVSRMNIPVNELTAGMYLLQLNVENGFVNYRVAVQ
ncbi:MAG: T9SS type A sorting domain-containing protein [Flavobacteriales bacterium]|nr:T9SS type A sorting domain-containing protein [Flavobacteriales bacterium]